MDFLNLNEAGEALKITKVAIQKKIDTNHLFAFKILNKKNYKYYIPKDLLEFNPQAYKNKECKIIAINNLKGGVGKTTVATNLATILSLLNKKILLVDMDPQANATTSFLNIENLDETKGVKELIDIFANKETPSIDIIKQHINTIQLETTKIDLLSSKISLAKAIDYLKTISHTAIFKLDTILKKLKSDYDYIIIDTPPNASIIMQMCLYASDSILAVTIPEQFPVNSMVELFEEIASMQTEIEEYKGNTIDMFGIVVNSMQNTKVHKAQLENIHHIAKNKNIDAIYEIPKNIKIAEAQDLKIPLCNYKDELENGAKGLEGILQIAYDIITTYGEKQ